VGHSTGAYIVIGTGIISAVYSNTYDIIAIGVIPVPMLYLQTLARLEKELETVLVLQVELNTSD
jgi:hypothetical protein